MGPESLETSSSVAAGESESDPWEAVGMALSALESGAPEDAGEVTIDALGKLAGEHNPLEHSAGQRLIHTQAVAYLQQQKYDVAIPSLRRLIEQSNEPSILAMAHRNLGAGLKYTGDEDGAMKHFRAAYHIFHNIEETEQIAFMDLPLEIGQALLRDGEPRKAERFLREAHALFTEVAESAPNDEKIASRLFLISLQYGTALAFNANFEEASVLLESIDCGECEFSSPEARNHFHSNVSLLTALSQAAIGREENLSALLDEVVELSALPGGLSYDRVYGLTVHLGSKASGKGKISQAGRLYDLAKEIRELFDE